MNDTVIGATVAEKVLLPLAVLPCLGLLGILYWYAKRRILPNESMDDRFYVFYNGVAGGILGQFLFHAFPNSTGQAQGSVFSIFVFLGLYVMLLVHRCLRVTTGLVNYTGPNVFRGVELKQTLDHETVAEAEYYSADLHNPQHFQAVQWDNTDEQHEKRRRRILVLLYYSIALIMSVFEGVVLVLTPVSPLAVGMYWFNKLMHSYVVGVMLVYGATHLRARFYWILASGWCISIIVTTVPVLIDMSPDDASMILGHGAAAVLYATSAGVLFWLSLNFLWLDSPRTSKKRTAAHILVLALFAAGSYVTGFFT